MVCVRPHRMLWALVNNCGHHIGRKFIKPFNTTTFPFQHNFSIYTYHIVRSIQVYTYIHQFIYISSHHRVQILCTWKKAHRIHDAMITSLWRRNDVATSFWRHNDVIIALCAHWEPIYVHIFNCQMHLNQYGIRISHKNHTQQFHYSYTTFTIIRRLST